jgi:hypothetical protein
MTMINRYLLSKKIHRMLVIIISFLTLAMTSTGFALKYPTRALFNPGLTRFLHNQLSLIFTLVLILMACSGLLMYLYPLLIKRPKPASPPKIPQP